MTKIVSYLSSSSSKISNSSYKCFILQINIMPLFILVLVDI
jgi:hypothetical protein